MNYYNLEEQIEQINRKTIETFKDYLAYSIIVTVITFITILLFLGLVHETNNVVQSIIIVFITMTGSVSTTWAIHRIYFKKDKEKI